MKHNIIKALRQHAEANIQIHKNNIDIYLSNPAGIGEHSDIMETIQQEIDKMAHHQERIDILDIYFYNE